MVFKLTGNKNIDKAYRHLYEAIGLLESYGSPYSNKGEKVEELVNYPQAKDLWALDVE